MRRAIPLFAALFLLGSMVLGTVFGTVRGIVHDPQHRPLSDATVTLQAKQSAFTQTFQTDAEGQFHFDAVPLGSLRCDRFAGGLPDRAAKCERAFRDGSDFAF